MIYKRLVENYKFGLSFLAFMLVGIVGKANVGKSTFFKSLTLAEVLIANYPFATLKPNRGVGFVRVERVDKEFGVVSNPRFGYCRGDFRFVPVELLDVAGLVPGAHEGKGMGNQFLDDLRQADVLIHVVDMSGSTNEKGEPVSPGSYDPVFDIKFLEFELDMWFLSIVKKGWDKFARQVQQDQADIAKALGKQLSGLKVDEFLVDEVVKKLNLSGSPLDWSEQDLNDLAVELRKRTKPIIIAGNKCDVPSAKGNLEIVRKKFPDYVVIPCSAESELALREADQKQLIDYVPGSSSFNIRGSLSDKQRSALDFIKKRVLDVFGSTGVQEVLDSAVFDVLRFIAVFPGGVNKLADSQGRVLPDCFLLPEGSTAFDFAGYIHSDFAKNFLGAIDVRTKRKIGRDAVLKHRDVIEILTSK